MTDKSRSAGFVGKFAHVKLDDEEREIPEEVTSESQIRQNFPAEIEEALNKQINLEFQACYTYRAMGIFFHSDDIALLGFSKFFFRCAEEEKGHAMRIMKYMNKRGGTVVLDDIEKPTLEDYGTGLKAMRTALVMEKSLNEVLLKLHKLAITHKDPVTDKFIKRFLLEQVKAIKMLGKYVTNLKRVGPGIGVYMFDKKTLKGDQDSSSSSSSSSSSDSSSSDSSDSSDSDD